MLRTARTARWKRMIAQTVLTGAVLLPATYASAETVTVKTGDTLGNLAASHKLSVEHLKIANHLPNDMIIAGTRLYIPPQSNIYVVQSGDTLWKIASKFQTTIAALREINQLSSDAIMAGDKMLVPLTPNGERPVGLIHTVASGEVLWKIASRYNVTIQSITDANKLTSTELLIGQKLLIPVSAPSTGPAPQPQPAESQPEQPATEQPQEEPNREEAAEPAAPSNGHRVELKTYRVVKGDTPWSISIAHGIPLDEFLKANNLGANAYLQIGQVVNIPVHHIPVTQTMGEKFGEYLDWFEAAQYLFPINAIAKVTDFETGRSFMVKRTIGAFHSDTEPLTAADTAIIKQIWGGEFSWKVRPVIVEVGDRRIAASMSSMPHSIEYIADNHFTGHFDIHFRNSLRHKDNQIDASHQEAVRVAAGVS